MKRSVIASLATVAVGAGLAFGQSGGQGNVLRTEDPGPAPSVIRLQPTPQNKTEPAQTQAPPATDTKIRNVPPKAKPKPQPVQKTNYSQIAPAVEPAKTPVLPAIDTPKAEVLPAPTTSAIPAIVSDGHVEHASHDERASYNTSLFGPILPWTKCGRRYCGTVYLDTPYHWVDARYLFGWLKKDRTVPLLTRGPNSAVTPGALDDPDTTVLFDGERLHDQPYMGGQLTAGCWFDECQYCGGEISYFFFGSQDKSFLADAVGAPGSSGLFIPFFNPLRGLIFPSQEDTFTIAGVLPGAVSASGVANITSRSRLQGGDGHFLFSFSRGMSFRCDAIAGVRWLGLDDDLNIETNTRFVTQAPFLQGNPLLPVDIGVRDHFGTRNDFIGGDVGFKSRFVNNCWSCDLLTRVAIGGNHRTFRGDGFTGITFLGIPTQFQNAGRLIGPANAGIFTSDTFSVVPEIGLTFGYQATRWCKLTAGYNWMYWTNVVRAGAQVDRVVNPVGVPTRPEFNTALYEPRRPGVSFNETDIWIQSVTLGMLFTF